MAHEKKNRLRKVRIRPYCGGLACFFRFEKWPTKSKHSDGFGRPNSDVLVFFSEFQKGTCIVQNSGQLRKVTIRPRSGYLV